ncbi:MAG TPA: GGDEF domain-containing protein, partial [Minicystis sp.]|nr:GGDEF domain-containing protein [Minicystis sp.]
GPFVVAPLRARGAPLGLVFADDRYAEPPEPLAADRVQHLDVFVDQAALVLDNLGLLARVAALARTDPLTGLANRRELDARFAAMAEAARGVGATLSLLVVDLDHFKATNDTMGHEAGDALLRTVATLLGRCVRAGDVLARYGGDEFVLILPGVDRAALATVARRIGREARSASISLSLGGASFPADAKAPEQLFAVADAALYASKRAGRGCAHLAEERVDFDGASPTA